MSSSIPTPATTIPGELRTLFMTSAEMAPLGLKVPGNATILDLYAYRLLKGNPSLTQAQLAEQLHKIVPWEFFKGQKFDINRWMGDGLFSAGPARDGILDGSAENGWPGTPFVTSSAPSSFNNVRAQHTNSVRYWNAAGSTVEKDNWLARQLYARHLFCLAMLFLPDNF
jgi:hypothetical protein